ncbi:ABC transporter substrate-binding protein [Sphaerisporangium sp. NPDC005288]|uniref:ABC transporter substrate-binding protein n=1 Tax=Sphaerisporangium sp. NPDC005288 TaxID=3155114 RepID=UPI0033A39654
MIRRLGPALVLLCCLSALSCGRSGGGESISVLGPWTGQEEQAFRAMFAGFEQATGIHVDYTGTRDARSVLGSEIHNGNPPDLAVLATPGELRDYAAAGVLRPVDDALKASDLRGQYGAGVGDLTVVPGPTGERHSYAVIVKAALKSIIWYAPGKLPADARIRLTTPGLTWKELTRVASGLGSSGGRPWCMGVEDTANSGWPGTDWIEDLLLHRSGPGVYDQWVAGTLPWTSAPVRQAWQAFGSVVAQSGDRGRILLTNFGRAGTRMFVTPPECFLDHQGSFITAFYGQALGRGNASPGPEPDFDFIPFPSGDERNGSPADGEDGDGQGDGQGDGGRSGAGQGRAEEVAADLLGMFRDTPAARRFLAHLTTRAAQETWIRRPASGAISLNRSVPVDAYPDALSRRIAETLTAAGAVRFDASDSMPQTMAAAFDHAVLAYIADPGRLDALLADLDQVRRAPH